MKLKMIAALSIGMGLALGQVQAATSATAAPASTVTLSSQKDKVSYAIGISIGENLKNQAVDVDPSVVLSGLKDAMSGAKPAMSEEEMTATMVSFQKELMAKRETQFKQQSAKNAEEGNAYLASNKSKPGVTTLPDGIQYKIVTAGTGAKPTDADTVTVDYEGKLTNGQVFDSSFKRGKPVTFQVSQVIPGWTEILKLMPTGSTWEVVIPPNLAYGEHGVGNMIGPNQTLVFKIHLVDVKKGTAAPKAAESKS